MTRVVKATAKRSARKGAAGDPLRKPLRLAYVEWFDACHIEGGWLHSPRLLDVRPSPMMSVGWVLDEGPEHVTLIAHGCNESAESQGNLCIPRGCITRITTLKIPNRGRRK